MGNDALYRKPNYFLRDYEWHYYIGGNCALKRRKYGQVVAVINHETQGSYEAFILRGDIDELKDPISVGVFTDSNEAQAIINQILEEKFNEDTSTVCRVD